MGSSTFMRGTFSLSLTARLLSSHRRLLFRPAARRSMERGGRRLPVNDDDDDGLCCAEAEAEAEAEAGDEDERRKAAVEYSPTAMSP